MIVDIFSLIDDAPLVLKRPLLPYTLASYRIPIFAVYNPQTTDWPEYPYYNETDLIIAAILIGGRRFPYTADRIPSTGFYTIHVEEGVSYIVIGFDLTTLWMYERIEIILTARQVFSYYGSHDPDGDPNPPMLISVPDIRKKADALKFAKFSFETIKLEFIKEKRNYSVVPEKGIKTYIHEGLAKEWMYDRNKLGWRIWIYQNLPRKVYNSSVRMN